MSTSPCLPRAAVSFGTIVSLALIAMLWAPPISELPDGIVLPTSILPSDGVESDWWSQVHHNLAQSEYRVSHTEEGLQAPNRAQNLRTYFREGRIEVVPRDADDADWTWSWQTTAWGRDGTMRQLAAATPSPDRARVEYNHADLIEWYENDVEGIEQGFTLHEPPLGEGELRIEGKIGGELKPIWTEPGVEIEFLDADGKAILQYSKLIAFDAEGRTLDSRMTLEDDLICLLIDDSDAAYPLLIDPHLGVPDWTFASGQLGAEAGASVATAGDVNGDGYSDVIIGAPEYDQGLSGEGKAFLFLGSRYGLGPYADWSYDGDIVNVHLGHSVASAGDVNGDGYDDVIVGGPEDNVPGVGEGAAWLFYGSASGLSSIADWFEVGAQAGACFGHCVATAGDVDDDGYDDVLIGVPHYNSGQPHEGAVLLYYGSSEGIPETPDLLLQQDRSFVYFGSSVATAGDINADGFDDVIVGGPGYDFSTNYGAAYLLLGSGTGLETSFAWRVHGDNLFGGFGHSVSTTGDVDADGYCDVIVGAPGEGGSSEGRAYVFRGTATGLEASPAWMFTEDEPDAYFGGSVATAGDFNGDGYGDFIIGADNLSDDQQYEGRATIYLGHHTTPHTNWYLHGDGDQAGAAHGACVATAGDVNGDGYSDVIVGAPLYNEDYQDAGVAHLYLGGANVQNRDPGWVTESNQDLAEYGYSIAGAGDVNADGFDDVLVSARKYDNGQSNEGAVFLFIGTHLGLSVLPLWYAEGDQADARFGTSVSSAGDVNGDGYADILIGAPGWDDSHTDGGAAFLWLGPTGSSPPGNPSNADWSAQVNQTSASFGCSVAPAGDVNGDGYGDIIVGAYGLDWSHSNDGGAFVYYGSAAGPSEFPDWMNIGNQEGAQYGNCVASAGDFNGDNFSDVIVAAYKFDDPEVDEGKVFLYTGSNEGLTGIDPYWTAQSDQAGARFGNSVAGAGDITADGYSDVIVGAPGYDRVGETIDGGAIFVWYGDASALPDGNPTNPDYDWLWLYEDENFGFSVASAGDINNDGYSDVLTGSPGGSEHFDREGHAGWILGSEYGLMGGYAHLFHDYQWDGEFGHCVAGVGDVDGNGFSDVMVGARNYDNPEASEGRAFLYYGNGYRGMPRSPRQWSADFSAPIAPGGTCDSESTFGLSAYARTAAGRGDLYMQLEVKPYGTPFDGTNIIDGSWVNTGPPSAEFGSVTQVLGYASDLHVGRQYCWRVRFVTDDLFFPRSPWFYPSGNAPTEADLRMAGWLSDTPEDDAIDRGLQLAPCSPNPFRFETMISYAIQQEGLVRLRIYDIQGRLVRSLIDRLQDVGTYTISWDGSNEDGRQVGAGVYFTRLNTGGEERTERIVRAK